MKGVNSKTSTVVDCRHGKYEKLIELILSGRADAAGALMRVEAEFITSAKPYQVKQVRNLILKQRMGEKTNE